MSTRVLVIGQLPPPVHGSNVMTKRFMEALKTNNISAEIVEKTFSNQLHEVGEKSLNKLLKIPSLYQRVNRAIRKERPNYCVYFISVGWGSLLVDCLILHQLKSKNIPYILYFHGMGYRNYEKLFNPLLKAVIRKSLSNALGGLVLGERLKEDVNHCIADDRLYVLPNGIPAIEKLSTYSEKDHEAVHVIFLSNLIPSKGPDAFLAMAREVYKQEPKVKFFLAGRHTSVDYLNKLHNYIKKEDLEGAINILGPVYGEDKDCLFNDADIMVFPTSFEKETFGIVNIEAMMWGIPVISSPKGAIPEIIRDGVNGFIVDPNNLPLLVDRVLTLVRNPELRQQMGRIGEDLFHQNYSLDAYTQNLKLAMRFFEQLAKVDSQPLTSLSNDPS